MRIALALEYDGSGFRGWQIQEGTRTVQGAVETALSKVADHAVRVVCAGRTDSGVHALRQIVHMDVEVEREMRAWVFGGNVNLPHDVSILWAQPVPDDFHARFKAHTRHYRYVIFNRSTRPAPWRNYTTWQCRPLDVDKMREAARHLIGRHDFSAYRALSCQAKSPVRTLSRLEVSRHGSLVILDLSANAFLHHMVRNIAGVLMAVGMSKAPPEWAKEVLETRDRTLGGVTAPPNGLYLCGVDYPECYPLPADESGGGLFSLF